MTIPTDATHQRRPEYVTAWLYVAGETIPTWLVEKYVGKPLPDHRLGRYALAIDGKFWRWSEADKFNEMFVAVAAVIRHEITIDVEKFTAQVAAAIQRSTLDAIRQSTRLNPGLLR